MSDENKTTTQGAATLNDAEHAQIHNKGKGKALDDVSMDDDSSSEEEEQVSNSSP